MYRVCGYTPLLLESAVGIEPQKLQFLTNMRVASLTRGALSAGIERSYHHRIACVETTDTGTGRADGARHLMTDNPMITNALIHMPQINMQIGTTNTTKGNITSPISFFLKTFHNTLSVIWKIKFTSTLLLLMYEY